MTHVFASSFWKTGGGVSFRLRRAKSKRGWRGRRGGSPARFIHLRRPLSERPNEAEDHTTPGHWEGDLMLFGVHKQPVLTLHERHSRLLIAARPPQQARGPHGPDYDEDIGPVARPVAPDGHLR